MQRIVIVFIISFIITIAITILMNYYVSKMNQQEINLAVATNELPNGLKILVIFQTIFWINTAITGVLSMIILFIV